MLVLVIEAFIDELMSNKLNGMQGMGNIPESSAVVESYISSLKPSK